MWTGPDQNYVQGLALAVSDFVRRLPESFFNRKDKDDAKMIKVFCVTEVNFPAVKTCPIENPEAEVMRRTKFHGVQGKHLQHSIFLEETEANRGH
jgi:hypothetical protein